MTDGEKPNVPVKALASPNNPPESPTTARPLDFDDEPQESGVVAAQTSAAPSSQQTPSNDEPPPKPPRPLSPMQQAENTLKEVFPSIDASVIKAVLVASDGNVERSFHALLGMSDPSAQIDLPPMMPPRPPRKDSPTQRQLEADEMYARQLAEHYSGASQRYRSPNSSWDHEPHLPRQSRETGLKPNELYDDREHNFFDDDLPIIKENIRKGFLETQTKVTSWVQNFKKKLEGDEEDEYGNTPPRPTQGYAQGYGESQTYRMKRSGDGRRSGDRERYDADPQVLGDDFSTLELRDSEAEPPRSTRPLANPDLFKSSSPSHDRRKVSFQEGPPEEISESYRPGSGSSNNKPSTGGNKSSKWQPLSAVEPSPVGDNDPFSLGDSDDEREIKNKDLKPDETEQVRKAAAEAKAGDIGSDPPKAGDNDNKEDNKPAAGS
ncbi:hypothetical protein ACO22_06120 [Paracoccidioides brasiliensis]|uniref:CUE domain-containing protein n=1 Tax=Paracoccidioides brasiliensis TaxID=121759 RepID=A0A1D2J8D8_PARBR|nr:hypothetical protein ACO22_06120 [Paracoccidioides brasiliensis]